jgi:hypothetical protein
MSADKVRTAARELLPIAIVRRLIKKIWHPVRPSGVPVKPIDLEALVPEELTIVTPEQFEHAYEEYIRFGPHRVIPLKERWPAVIPEVDSRKYAALAAVCHSVEWEPVRWACELINRGVPDPYGAPLEKLVARKFPFLVPERRRRICSYALFVNR